MKYVYYPLVMTYKCKTCLFDRQEATIEAVIMGALYFPVVMINLLLYILVTMKLRERINSSTNTRDTTLTRAFLLLSISWMVLWSPIIVFKVVYGFMDKPNFYLMFDFWHRDFTGHRKYYLAEFVVEQLSLLFSSVNSVILIVLLRPFHKPHKKLIRFHERIRCKDSN